MTDSGSMDPATVVIREEEKRMEEQSPEYKLAKAIVDAGVLNRGIDQAGVTWNLSPTVDDYLWGHGYALTAAENSAEERLKILLMDTFLVRDDDAKPLARALLAHADVLADILKQSKEVK